MHISVRHDIFYYFASGVLNIKNEEKKIDFVAHFHKVFRPRLLTPFDLRFAPNERPHRLSYLSKTALLVLILEKLA